MIDLTTELTVDESNMNRIINIIVKETGIGFNLLKDKTRKRPIVIARHTAMYFIKLNHPEIPLKSIGRHFGDRDHSTVIHGLLSIGDLFDTNKQFNENLKKICNAVNVELLPKLGQVQKYSK